MRKNGNAKRALHELLSRELWRGDEHEFKRLFHVGGQDIRFGPEEFCLFTGLIFGESSFNPHGNNHIIPSTSLYHTYYGGNGVKVKVKQLWKDFTDASRIIGMPDQYLKAANILCYYYLILCRNYDRNVDDWVWTLAEDLERWGTFSWGSWGFQIMCHQLGVAKKDPQKIGGRDTYVIYHLYGPVWALYFWAFKAIPSLGEKCGRRLNNDQWPILRRWEMDGSYDDFVDFFNDPRFVFVWHVSNDHWVFCRVVTDKWTMEVYDSLLHTMPNAADKMHRKVQLYPILKLWPRVLQQVGYWDRHSQLQKQTDFSCILFGFPLRNNTYRRTNFHVARSLVCISIISSP